MEGTKMNIKPGFTTMFNGKDLSGWVGDTKYWKAEDECIVAQSVDKLERNLFLWTEKEYSNFVMSADIKLIGFNSGIQFRSFVDENSFMHGYQADIGDGCWGSLYEERIRGVVVSYKPQLVEPILKNEDWNEMQIFAVDDYIIQTLNGVITVEFYDPPGAKKGIFGLQLHGGPPQTISFRNLCIKEFGV
jgi:hypothetical protein